jgi:hypothetical protein
VISPKVRGEGDTASFSINTTRREPARQGGGRQGRIKSLRGPRPVFRAGPQSTEKCGKVGVS